MKQVICFLDEIKKKKININSIQQKSGENPYKTKKQEEKKVEEKFEEKEDVKEEEKEKLHNLVNKINKNFDSLDINYGWDYKDIKKYISDKKDPNLYNTLNIKIPLQIRISSPLKAPRNRKVYPIIKKEMININVEINSIEDLISVIKNNPLDSTKEYNINMESLHNIKPYLERLDQMIGMKDLKENILDQILYFIQDLHKNSDNKITGEFMHTVIYGPPGTGKTEVAKIIGKIFCKLDILKKGTFRKVTRTDLVAGYLGQTAAKTNDVINDCLGGVLFIDEAYALGNAEKRDSFSKECIDTLCEGLSNHKDKLMVIIAGYENELKECFFAYNQGLESRFNWRFKTGEYNGKELYDIFIKKVNIIGWSVDKTIDVKWFEKNKVYFKYYGRDIETVLSKVKIAHSRRIFGKSSENKKTISIKDLEKGFDNFLKIEEVKNRKNDADQSKRIGMLYV